MKNWWSYQWQQMIEQTTLHIAQTVYFIFTIQHTTILTRQGSCRTSQRKNFRMLKWQSPALSHNALYIPKFVVMYFLHTICSNSKATHHWFGTSLWESVAHPKTTPPKQNYEEEEKERKKENKGKQTTFPKGSQNNWMHWCEAVMCAMQQATNQYSAKHCA